MKRSASLFVALLWVVADAAGEDANRFTMALTGDTEITRKLSVFSEFEFLKMVGILRNADVAFTNLELLLHDYEGWAAAEADGPYQRVDPSLVDELVWLGIDMVSHANNHAKDYGVTGMRVTTKHVLAAGPMNAEAVIAVPEWRSGAFHELRLYPISLGHGEPRTVRGRPMLAEPTLAKKILDDVVRFSAPFGTRIEIRNNVGIISAGAAASEGDEP